LTDTIFGTCIAFACPTINISYLAASFSFRAQPNFAFVRGAERIICCVDAPNIGVTRIHSAIDSIIALEVFSHTNTLRTSSRGGAGIPVITEASIVGVDTFSPKAVIRCATNVVCTRVAIVAILCCATFGFLNCTHSRTTIVSFLISIVALFTALCAGQSISTRQWSSGGTESRVAALVPIARVVVITICILHTAVWNSLALAYTIGVTTVESAGVTVIAIYFDGGSAGPSRWVAIAIESTSVSIVAAYQRA